MQTRNAKSQKLTVGGSRASSGQSEAPVPEFWIRRSFAQNCASGVAGANGGGIRLVVKLDEVQRPHAGRREHFVASDEAERLGSWGAELIAKRLLLLGRQAVVALETVGDELGRSFQQDRGCWFGVAPLRRLGAVTAFAVTAFPDLAASETVIAACAAAGLFGGETFVDSANDGAKTERGLAQHGDEGGQAQRVSGAFGWMRKVAAARHFAGAQPADEDDIRLLTESSGELGMEGLHQSSTVLLLAL